jgi:hypothetical protein
LTKLYLIHAKSVSFCTSLRRSGQLQGLNYIKITQIPIHLSKKQEDVRCTWQNKKGVKNQFGVIIKMDKNYSRHQTEKSQSHILHPCVLLICMFSNAHAQRERERERLTASIRKHFTSKQNFGHFMSKQGWHKRRKWNMLDSLLEYQFNIDLIDAKLYKSRCKRYVVLRAI